MSSVAARSNQRSIVSIAVTMFPAASALRSSGSPGLVASSCSALSTAASSMPAQHAAVRIASRAK